MAKAEAIRQKRLKDLGAREYGINAAVDLYQSLDTGDHPDIRIRSGFIRLEKPRAAREAGTPLARREADAATRPPNTRLINRPGNAQQAYLTGIYVAHQEFESGDLVENRHHNVVRDGWADLCGLRTRGVDTRELNLRVTRALKTLDRLGLVTVADAGSPRRYHGFRLNSDDGFRRPYSVPGASTTNTVVLPAGFFRAGWHLVLTPEEMATLLVIMEHTRRLRRGRRKSEPEDGIAIPDKLKWSYYGLAHEAYGSVHELCEFGLIEIYDPDDRTRGRIPDSRREDKRALRLTYPASPGPDYGLNALDVVRKHLTDNPIPPRLQ
ncbi:hypothetical protein [Mycobacterium sp. Marseille-P9652]|uniref:hypothetical protein n=1 Tax=Mycobacterium sp. Marseille-P9652 TaxID=2654950 RepID=UPI0012E951D3|nr:hypothetical protein [Mycobacterium sp. Marseille-P9652]